MKAFIEKFLVPALVTLFVGWAVFYFGPPKEAAAPVEDGPKIVANMRAVEVPLTALDLGWARLSEGIGANPTETPANITVPPVLTGMIVAQMDIVNSNADAFADVTISLDPWLFTTIKQRGDYRVVDALPLSFRLNPSETVTINGLIEGQIDFDGSIFTTKGTTVVASGDKVIPINLLKPSPPPKVEHLYQVIGRNMTWWGYPLLAYVLVSMFIGTVAITHFVFSRFMKKPPPPEPAPVPDFVATFARMANAEPEPEPDVQKVPVGKAPSWDQLMGDHPRPKKK